ncbi:MAG: polysaccharide export protein [Acidobacteriia bacterium]|nr:polysaccharide export protein [Terriglobia bacterium]
MQAPAAPVQRPSGDATDPAKMAAPAVQPGQKLPGTAPVDEKTYVIGAEDVVRVNTWGHQDVSGDFNVRPDGRISIPLIGEVQAAGLTPKELETEIANRLKASFIRNPNVTVGLTAVRSKSYFINGEVNKPGKYDLVVPTRILEALVNAGGFRDFADKKHITIIRGDKRFFFNFNDAIKGKHPERNILLEPGDVIMIK